MITTISTQLPPLSPSRAGDSSSASVVKDVPAPKNAAQLSELNEDQQEQVDNLKKTDQEVRAHETAHKNAGGQYAGNATFSYQVGPDGKRYAVGGEVPIDVAPIKDDPEATLAKLDVVIAAALAPAKPSAQDRKVAASAVAARNQARTELLEKNKAEDADQNPDSATFDVNDFGDTPLQSVNKAYESGNGLGEQIKSTGGNISVTS